MLVQKRTGAWALRAVAAQDVVLLGRQDFLRFVVFTTSNWAVLSVMQLRTP